MKIGFFDSGIGGLSVLHLAMKEIPDGQFMFYADRDHVPYGEKTAEQIIGYVDQAIRFFIEHDAGAVVIACNTATSAAIEQMRGKYSIPIIGMEPAVKLAVCRNSDCRILVAATPVTVKGDKMKDLIRQVDIHQQVDLIALPELVNYAEQGIFETEEVRTLLIEKLKPFDLSRYSFIVLGCTHFNYFKGVFKEIVPSGLQLIDGNEGTVNRLADELRRVHACEIGALSVEYYYSGRKVVERDELLKIESCYRHLDQMQRV